MTGHISSKRLYLGVFAALMLLLAATVAAAQMNLGPFNEVVWLVIAVIKAALVLLFFMHLRHSSRMTWLFAAAGLLWFGLLLSGTLADYLTRLWSTW